MGHCASFRRASKQPRQSLVSPQKLYEFFLTVPISLDQTTCTGPTRCSATPATRGVVTRTWQGFSSRPLSHRRPSRPPPPPLAPPNTPLNYFVAPFPSFNASVEAPPPDADPPADEEVEPLFALAAASPSSFENSRSGSPAPEISSRLHLKSNTLDSTTLNIWMGRAFRVRGTADRLGAGREEAQQMLSHNKETRTAYQVEPQGRRGRCDSREQLGADVTISPC